MSEVVKIGPYHPALLEPEAFELKVDKDVIVDAKMTLGYVHRGIEKLASTRTYHQDLFLCSRVCGICSGSHSQAFVQTAEGVMDVQVPDRAKYIRTIMTEIERLESHFIWFAVLAHGLKNHEMFAKTIADRESVMDLFELIAGNRVTKAMNWIGGVRRDLSDQMISEIKKTLQDSKGLADYLGSVVKTDETLRSKAEGVGVLSRKKAEEIGPVGPSLRGSGISSDVRKDDPYAAYGEIDFDLITEPAGDVLSRVLVRHREVYESIRIIEQALDGLPKGPIKGEINGILETDCVSRVEAPRGELFYYIRSNGTNIPERVKIRTPSFLNDFALLEMLKGDKLENAQIIIESIDPCFSCTDRVMVTDVQSGKRRPMDLGSYGGGVN